MNYDLFLEIIRGYEVVVQNLQILSKKLEKYPKGWIEAKTQDGITYHYYRYIDDSGKKRSQKIKDLDAMQQMMDERNVMFVQKRYYQQVREQYEKTMKYFKIDYNNLALEVQRRYEAAAEDEKIYLEELKKVQKKKYSDQYLYATLSGAQVQSKSEMMIADTLTRKGIQFKYEEVIIINGYSLKPDFTIIYRDQVYYWEHLGLMDKEEYRKSWEWKKEKYKQAGIVEGVNLIVTRESKGHPFTQLIIDHCVLSYFGV